MRGGVHHVRGARHAQRRVIRVDRPAQVHRRRARPDAPAAPGGGEARGGRGAEGAQRGRAEGARRGARSRGRASPGEGRVLQRVGGDAGGGEGEEGDALAPPYRVCCPPAAPHRPFRRRPPPLPAPPAPAPPPPALLPPGESKSTFATSQIINYIDFSIIDFCPAQPPPPASARHSPGRRICTTTPEREFIDYTTSVITDEEPLRGLLFY